MTTSTTRKDLIAKVWVQIGPSWPQGRAYLVDAEEKINLASNFEQYKSKTYGYVRIEQSKPIQTKAVIKTEGLDYQERYFPGAQSTLARKWLKAEVNRQLKK